MENQIIPAIVGPTASGKSRLAEALALRLDGEIVSCDSMQVYRGMDIGTAKPTAAERARVRYHLIDIADPDQAFSAADYAAAAADAVREIRARGKLPIVCGGTGLYLEALLRGTPETPGSDPALRRELEALAAERGAPVLYRMLSDVDPESAAATHPNNLRRVIRALEIYRITGVPKSEWDRRSREAPPAFPCTVIGLFFHDRDLLYRRIDGRTDDMIRAGLPEEVRALYGTGVFERSPTAAGAIGYKEFLPYLSGACDLITATEELKAATRRYAKRQITWFSAKPYIRRLFVDEDGKMRNFEEIVNNSMELFDAPGNMV